MQPWMQCIVLVCLVAGGCAPEVQRWMGRGPRRLGSVTERLQRAYADLAGGRFVSLADFERPEQADMLRVVGPDDRGLARVTARRSRPETGAGALRVLLPSPRHALVATSQAGGRWSLLRDWRDYELLLMSIYVPQPVDDLRVEVRGAAAGQRFWLTHIPLEPGWNLLRIDLADVGATVDLAAVEQVRWSFTRLDASREFYLDDVLLADNREVLLPADDGQEGRLYVERAGRRVHVGAAGRFEVVLAGGVIRQWFALSEDASKVRSLSGQTLLGLGLLGPVVAPMSDDEPVPAFVEAWARYGTVAEAHQRLVEASPLRAVVEGEWRFAERAHSEGASAGHRADAMSRPEDGAGSRPRRLPAANPAEWGEGSGQAALRCRYVIYGSGDVYYSAEARMPAALARAQRLGIVVGCRGDVGFRTATGRAGSLPDAAPFALLWRGGTGADLLIAPHDGRVLPEARFETLPPQQNIAAVFRTAPVLPEERVAAAVLLRFWPPDADGPEYGSAVAGDYARPPKVVVEMGELVRTDAGDFNNDGYNESEGCFVLRPEDGRVRMRVDSGTMARFGLRLKIVDSTHRRMWCYANGAVVETHAPTANGAHLFVIDRPYSEIVLIEVYAEV